MTDVKYKKVTNFMIGYDSDNKTTILEIIDYKDKVVSPEGDLVKPFAAINDKTAQDVIHQYRYVLVELITNGWNREAFLTQQVVVGDATSRALRQGADNDPIGYLVATLDKPVGADDTVTYESGRGMLSGLHIHVSNRKGTKYNPCTFRFKVRGTRV